ncbi:hypothetical protein [Stenotrophomonas indicatrix]|uniref:hypothetical protein n=1 Tax=Stenotrophomonas indicatrix TaxID=2045451 RepID=UPI0007395022|nr:hypothetical protein [Stenotrophomonas indicatrix]CRD48004.1 conserved hypothetical protein [Stenotrophomonas indicatrix]
MEQSAQTWKFIQTITPALIGFAGVCVGAGITVLREYFAGRGKSKTDGAYLAAIVGGALDTLISGCSDVVGDNGQVDTDGYSHPRAAHPQFDPQKLDVEWRTIPPDLLFDIQDLPYQLLFAEGAISDASEYAATPPDYEEYFEERQFQFARLGLHCISIADRLRAHAKLTARSKSYQWDPKVHFQQKIEKIEAQRAKPVALPDIPRVVTGQDFPS